MNGQLRPRKEPVQRRAHETRARILDAAAEVFADHGYGAGTTNRIAAVAGISVGSLYQYFPNKDSILVELTRRHLHQGSATFEALLADGRPSGIEALVRMAVDAMVDAHADDHRLHRVLFEEAPRPPSLLRELHEWEDRLVTLAAEVLRDDPDPGIDVDDPVLAAQLVVVTIESVVHRLVTGARPVDPDALRAELTRMVLGYLRPAPDRPADAASAQVPDERCRTRRT